MKNLVKDMIDYSRVDGDIVILFKFKIGNLEYNVVCSDWGMVADDYPISIIDMISDQSGLPPITLESLNKRILELRYGGHISACGRGDTNPKIVFIGEALGEQEEKQRSPFVGPAGQMLDSLLKESGLADVPHYITNAVKHRPTEPDAPRNRQPDPDEIDFWTPILREELTLLNPEVVVPLGLVATSVMLHRSMEDMPTMSQLHGNDYGACDSIHWHIIPTYHPAATLYRSELRDVVLNDFKYVRTLALSPEGRD